MIRDWVFLPATEPDDTTYGVAPARLDEAPECRVHHVRFDSLVWYNRAVRRQAAGQIDAMGLSSFALVGFSKSGLGAINLACELGRRVAATVVFDAPVARLKLPPWDTEPFYAGDEDWLADLPMANAATVRQTLPQSHRLILISGEGFHDEMEAFSRRLDELGLGHVFLPRPRMKHHWNSGWLAEAIAALRADPMRHAKGESQ
ncbi:MAG TPA: hypothetical protein PK082_03210 [Phycisphaerae bacterium]|nr:hypothetical protein [Phycisphaerae bacterium]